VIYAWCPLVIKEIANSGHLDALAYFLATLAVALMVRALYGAEPGPRRAWCGIGATMVLALACGAKLYPVILLPLFAISLRYRLGWKCALAACLAFGLVLAPLVWPMLPDSASQPLVDFDPAQVAPLSADLPPAPPQEVSLAPRDPSESLRAFLGEWEMNDFLFLIVVENLRPAVDGTADPAAWFTIVPQAWREAVVSYGHSLVGVESRRIPFLLARGGLSAIFLVVAGVLAWRARAADAPRDWLAAAFLTIAWFWLLLPTLNPWYWTWAVALLPFATGRTWLAVSGLAFIYYFRFWLMHHAPTAPFLGTAYTGPQFFDFVITWLEFGPWLLALMAAAVWRRRSQTARMNTTKSYCDGFEGPNG
jgi:hypothetical protein